MPSGDLMDTEPDFAQKLPPKLTAGALVDRRFSIIEEIGSGGMSVVYKAKDLTLDRLVALKVLPAVSDPAKMKRFKTEVQAYAMLDHPNIVRVLASGIGDDGTPFFVMELLSGHTLEEKFNEKRKFTMSEFADLFLPLLAAFKECHARGIVHRDIKPGNIMICSSDDGTQIPKILDFGIAKFITPSAQSLSQSVTAAALGSPLYMSPEQVSGKPVDERSDIYSLACVMYQSLTTKPPFAGDTPLETMYEHLRKSLPKIEEVSTSITISKELVNSLIKALAKDSSKRQRTMGEFESEIKAALSSTNLKSGKRFVIPQAVLVLVCMAPAVLLMSFWLKGRNHEEWRPARISHAESGLSPKSMFETGLLEEKRKNMPAAISMYEKVWSVSANLDPKFSLEVCKHLAFLYDSQQDFEKANRVRLKAMQRLNKGSELYIGLGNTVVQNYNSAGFKEQASSLLADLEKSVIPEAKNTRCYAELMQTKGKMLLLEGKVEEAILAFKESERVEELNSRGFPTEFSVTNSWLLHDAYKALKKNKEADLQLAKTKNVLLLYKRDLNQMGTGIAGLVYNQRSVSPAFIAYVRDALRSRDYKDVRLLLQMAADHARAIPNDKRTVISEQILALADAYSNRCGLCQIERAKLKQELIAERKPVLAPRKPNSPNVETITRLLHPTSEE